MDKSKRMIVDHIYGCTIALLRKAIEREGCILVAIDTFPYEAYSEKERARWRNGYTEFIVLLAGEDIQLALVLSRIHEYVAENARNQCT